MSDPLPQAMVLTAIVITLGMVAFVLALAYRSWQIDGHDEVQDDVEDRRIVRRAELDETSASYDDDTHETSDEEGRGGEPVNGIDWNDWPRVLLPLPVVLPLFAAGLTLALARRPRAQRTISVTALSIVVAATVAMLVLTDRGNGTYSIAVGGWPSRLGIRWWRTGSRRSCSS